MRSRYITSRYSTSRFATPARLLLAGAALAVPFALLAEPAKMPIAGPHPGMMGRPPMCGHGGPQEGGMDPLPPFLREANLDEAQRDKIFLIMHTAIPQLREQEKVRTKARQALAELGMSGQYSDARAKVLADTLARATSEIELIRSRSDSQIAALLTPEQRSGVAQARKTMGAMPPHEPPCMGPRS